MNNKLDFFNKNCVNIELTKVRPYKTLYYLKVDEFNGYIIIEDFSRLLESIIKYMRDNEKFNNILQRILFMSMTVFINGVEVDYSQFSVFFNIARDCVNINN